ncbi:MAG: VirB4 family type IV secretion/conjugal transfer ATPase [Rhodocyclaceae bacterium]|nr:VirB4 family type IV secretion/conjugal transfer ATPase [Rhodocyclaceae bacterium]
MNVRESLGLQDLPDAPHLAHRAHLRQKANAHIPYACHYDENIVMTRNDDLLLTIQIAGLPFETADQDVLVHKKELRNHLLKSLSGSRHAVYVHTVRRRETAYPGGIQPPGFVARLDREWREHHRKTQVYVNDIYLTFVVKPRLAGKMGLIDLLSGMSRKRDERERAAWLQDQARTLHEKAKAILVSLGEYSPRLLGQYEDNGITYSDTLRFLSFLVNGEDRPIRVPSGDLAAALPYTRHIFGTDAFETRGIHTSTVSAMLAIKSYPDHTHHGMMDHFLSLPCEMIACQSFIFSDPTPALNRMKQQQRRMEQVEDDATSQVEEICNAMDDLASSRVAYGHHHMTVQVKAASLRELEDTNLPMVSNALMRTTAIAVREDLCMESSFWAQLPGNFKYIPRPSLISSRNLASLASLHNHTCGTLTGNHWGDAVTMLETTSGTPYYFNWHVRDVGHTAICAPTGTGKSVMNNFLIAMSQKHNPRVFFFDKDYGAYPYILAMEGTHHTLSKGVASGFNPLQLDDTDRNRNFLRDWFELMLTSHGETLTAEEAELINKAVDVNYSLDRKDRILRNVVAAFGKQGTGSTRNRIDQWVGDGAYARLFDNDEDTLSFSQHLYGFEMGQIIEDERATAPVMAYLLHRIRLSLDGKPLMIVLEEGAQLLRSPYFQHAMTDWLQTLRKSNGMVIFVSPDPASLYKHESLIKQTSTQIYLANPKATREEYIERLHLTEGEFEAVRALNAANRTFLIKHDRDSVLARLDLAPVGWAIPVLSGRPEYKQTIDRLITEAGGNTDPAVWLDEFIAAHG